ncbi:MAG: VanZ family protein, partial [Myxococcota bacterium]
MAHFPLYAGFASLVLMAFAGRLRALAEGPWPALWTFGAVCAYAVTDEYHQSFVPGRSSALGDLALDAAGAACAILIMTAIARRRPAKRALTEAGQAGFARADLLLPLLAGLLALLLYLPSLRNGFMPFWDDDDYVLKNASVQALTWPSVKSWLTEPVHGNYAPLVLGSLAIDHALWGLDPAGYHLHNALLHALASGLLVWLLMSLRAPPLAAGVAGALYLVHPVQVESVAWISERKSLLATIFLLLSFIVYARATRPAIASRGGLWLSFLLFVAALLSKLSAVVLPGVFFLYDLGYRRAPLGRILREKVP